MQCAKAIRGTEVSKGMKALRSIMPAFACAAVLTLIGASGVWAGEPWLVASLGASTLLQILTPRQRAAHPWSTAVGQLVGLAAGLAGVYAVGAASAPAVASGEPVTWIRVAAVAVAIALAAAGQQALRAQNPAGGSTSLLIALGKIPPTLHGTFVVVVGILLVTIIGETARWAVLRLDKQ